MLSSHLLMASEPSPWSWLLSLVALLSATIGRHKKNSSQVLEGDMHMYEVF